jgi:hypothetical protein
MLKIGKTKPPKRIGNYLSCFCLESRMKKMEKKKETKKKVKAKEKLRSESKKKS